MSTHAMAYMIGKVMIGCIYVSRYKNAQM